MGTTVLKNIPGIREPAALQEFETAISVQRSDEPLPGGRNSVRHYCAVHRHLFQDVYRWAGRFRTVRITKRESTFCFPENIRREMKQLFSALRQQDFLRGLTSDEFPEQSAHFLADPNAIHPFRDGNGRSQVVFLAVLAEAAGHPLTLARLEAEAWLDAMVQSFAGNTEALAAQIRGLVAGPD